MEEKWVLHNFDNPETTVVEDKQRPPIRPLIKVVTRRWYEMIDKRCGKEKEKSPTK